MFVGGMVEYPLTQTHFSIERFAMGAWPWVLERDQMHRDRNTLPQFTPWMYRETIYASRLSH